MDHGEGHDHGGMMDQCMEMMSNMMGGSGMMDGMMGNSFLFLLALATLFIVWFVFLAALGGLSFFAVRRLRRAG
jgi:hypothetical protein